ncbi:MAG: allophanate hydrolase [Verrucomicrobia bacterium]|nr:MAG: allophanate hydrolase [Verrucomicrobiota bacterium]PYM12235.1 MAG: allophanate hydrolase [Verrucomicrobiota bacterium]
MNWMPYGPRALLFRFAETVGEEALARQRGIVTELQRHPPAGLVEFVPAFTTILLEFDSKVVPEPDQVAEELLERLEAAAQKILPPAPVKEIPVRYDGADLEAMAKAKGMTVEQVCDLHSAPLYNVYMLGFSPGFPYLGDLDPRLHTPRLASPRPKVRAGSVAIGGEHTGIYTVDSPGGWNIIGHTPLRIFDPARGEPNGPDEAMFRLKPGDRVKFVRI